MTPSTTTREPRQARKGAAVADPVGWRGRSIPSLVLAPRWLIGVCAILLASCAGSTQGEPEGASLRLPDLPHRATLRDGIITSGTPTPRAVREAAELGVRALVSLQPFDEDGARDAFEAAEAAGLEVRHLPVAGAEALTFERARALGALLEELPRPLIVHCSTGNRVGGLFALLAHLEGLETEAALEVGRRAGLTKAEPAVVAALRDAAEHEAR